MVEKKQVLYDLRTTYNGPFLVEDFYAEVENWIKEKGLEKEPKKKICLISINPLKKESSSVINFSLKSLNFFRFFE